MKKETAHRLGPLVKGSYFNALVEYANERIEMYHKQLENEQEHERVLKYQGAIKELRLLTELKDRAEDSMKQKD